MSKHILHIITEPTGGGAERVVRELNKNLPNYGIDSSTLFLMNPSKEKLLEREECLGLDKLRAPLNPIRLRKFLLKYDPKKTILHGHLVDALYLLSIPFVADKFQKIYTEHSTHNQRRNRPFFFLLEQYVYSKYFRIICISNAVKENLSKWLKLPNTDSRIHTIYNGSRLFHRNYTPRNSVAELRFISVGSLKFVKGFDMAIRAFANIDGLNYSYKIIGEGVERESLEKLISELNLESKIKLIGPIQDNIEEYYWNSDIQIIPSRWEGFGLVAIEGMSAGLPLIVSNVEGLREVAGKVKSTMFFNPFEVNELSNAILEMSKLGQYYPEFFQNSVSMSNNFSIEEMVKNYSKMYSEL